MKVLVTGAAGFIGSHLTELLLEKGHKVKAFIRYDSRNNWGWLEKSKYHNDIEIYRGDIRDYDSVSKAVMGVKAVFHLAALIGIPYSYLSPNAYIKTNIEGTYNVLESAKQYDVFRVIHTSTSEVYGTAQYVPIDEAHPYNPQSPYAATKAAADHLALSYHKSFELPVTVIRPFNTYGPRQSARAIIPTVITQILGGKKDITLGNLTPTRDLNFVLDTVAGFYEAGLHDNTIGEVINIGNGKEIAVGSLVNKIAHIMEADVKVIEEKERYRPAKSEVERLLSNPDKIMNLTGWKPKYTLDQGIKFTVDWLEENMHDYKPDIYNV